MKPTKRDEALEAFRIGAARHQAGSFAEAEAAYKHALALMPDFSDCLSMLGVLEHQTGRGDQAVRHLRRAVTLRPTVPQYHHNLGGVLREIGKPAEAIKAYTQVLRYQRNQPETYRELGRALVDLKQREQAAEAFQAALELNPLYLDAINDLGNVLVELDRPAEAVACFDTAIELRPTDPKLHNNKSLALRALYRHDAAIAACREAVRLKPDFPNAWLNLGNLLQEENQFAAALSCLERSMALIPNSPDPYQNLGTVLYRQRRLQDAVEIFRRGLQVAPESAHLTENLGYAALALGDYELGFACWEARWRIDLYRSGWHQSTAPTWDGARSLAGKTILLFAEQGLGDTMQFVRFVPELAARGARVLLMVQQPLVSLLRGVQGVEACFGLDDKPPRYDVQYPLLSLPHALGTRLDDIPADIPYLAAEPGSVAAWRERLASIPGLKIGLVWAGDPRPHQPEASRLDRRRSVRFDQLAPLAGIAGVSFVSLQKGKAAEQARTALPDLELHDWTSELNSFADTAALVEALDVVISVDTSVVHLGGALGRPVWLLNRFDSCWRWLDGRDDSPWYPTLRQFRQARPGDWDEVLARVRAALETLAAA